jgi:hypothetical protein
MSRFLGGAPDAKRAIGCQIARLLSPGTSVHRVGVAVYATRRQLVPDAVATEPDG